MDTAWAETASRLLELQQKLDAWDHLYIYNEKLSALQKVQNAHHPSTSNTSAPTAAEGTSSASARAGAMVRKSWISCHAQELDLLSGLGRSAGTPRDTPGPTSSHPMRA